MKMPYRLLNIGQLLFSLPNPELKQKVRILEKLNKRFINAKIGTIFNRTYIYISIWHIGLNGVILSKYLKYKLYLGNVNIRYS